MQDLDYFAGRAWQCYRLAKGCDDDEAAERIYEMGREFAFDALALGADPRLLPEFPSRGATEGSRQLASDT
jgi:hypothetical protein